MTNYHTMTRLFTFILTFLFSVCLQAQQQRFFAGTRLSCSHIKSLAQDTEGFIWIATENGLNKFDGWSTTTFYNIEGDTTSLLNNYLEKLHIDRQGRLWVGATRGLQLYVPRHRAFRTVRFTDGNAPSVLAMTETTDGGMIAVTAGYGAYAIDRSRLVATPASQLNKLCGTKFMHYVFEDHRGRLWIALPDAHIVCIDRSRKHIATAFAPVMGNKVYSIREDKKGRLWASTSSYVLRYDEKSRRFVPLAMEGISTPGHVRGIAVAPDGQIFVATQGLGLRYIDIATGTVRPAPGASATATDNILALLTDSRERLWLGYERQGLGLYTTRRPFFTFVENTQMAAPGSLAAFLFQDHAGKVWTSFSDGRVLRLSASLALEQSIAAPRNVRTIFQSHDGTYYMGLDDGLALFSPTSGALTRLPQFAGKSVAHVGEGDDGTLYVGVAGEGFALYNPKTGTLRTIGEATRLGSSLRLQNNWVNAFRTDSHGRLWIAHCMGVDCYDPDARRLLPVQCREALRGRLAHDIMEGRDGRMWIATHDGLYCYDPHADTTRHFTTSDGLPSNVICGLATARDGGVWCSTFNGICRVSAVDGSVVCRRSGNGLQDTEYRVGTTFQCADGTMYLAGLRGLTAFNPSLLKPRKSVPMPVLTHFYAGERELSAATRLGGTVLTDTTLRETERLHITYRENTFSMEFSTLTYAEPENTRFEYRIRELSDDWQLTALGENSIGYTFLDPGTYTVEVRTVEHGMKSEIRRYTLRISPPWYDAWWAWLIYLMLAAALATLLVRSWQRHQRDRQLSVIHEERVRFFINIAHDLRSPLTLIVSPLASLIATEGDAARRRTLQTIQHNARRIIKLTSQILDIRRIDKGQMTIHCQETEMVGYIEDLFQMFDYQAEKRGITFTFEHDVEYIPAWIDRDNFDKVLLNLLSNAFKYTPDGGKIVICVGTQHGASAAETDAHSSVPALSITVTDSGVGISVETLKHIFERFYQGAKASQGYGIGLNLTKMIVGLHHGTITAANRTDGHTGSVFTVTLPLGNKHLRPEELLATNGSTPTAARAALTDETYWETDADTAPKLPKAKSATRVLVVDDDAEMRAYLTQELGIYYKVQAACNGREAYQKAIDWQPAIIVSDVMMPVMDGYELLREVKANANISHIPFVLLTSQADSESRTRGWAVGADAFLAKPFNVAELMAICQNLIAGRQNLRGRFSTDQRVEAQIQPIEVKANDEVFMEKLMKAINKNLAESHYTVEDLASDVGMSRVQLHRKIKALTGNTTTEFIRNIRLKQAATILKEHKVNISQTAYLVGFSSPTLFSIAFKKFYGCTPTEYAEREG